MAKNNHSKILRQMKRYSNEEVQRPRRKIRLMVLAFCLLIAWAWTFSADVSGIAWLVFLAIGVFIALDIKYLLGRNPMNDVIANMSKQFEKHSDF